MTHTEQGERIAELKYLTRLMSRDDLTLFEMFEKRHRDDEDLDTLSQKKLVELCSKYAGMKKKPTIKNPFGK
jgi:hypothetical protein